MNQPLNFKTVQERFWEGQFGSEYIRRNASPCLLASNLAFFSQALRRTRRISSVLELGANVGMNLQALQALLPDAQFAGVEINRDAANALKAIIEPENVYCESILDLSASGTWDLTLSKGVLIHIEPDFLPEAYEKLYTLSQRYILVSEYYNPSPVAVKYRGHDDKLFKRDFAGEMLDQYSDLRLVDYGFVYHRDPTFPQDDLTWFLMEKAGVTYSAPK